MSTALGRASSWSAALASGPGEVTPAVAGRRVPRSRSAVSMLAAAVVCVAALAHDTQPLLSGASAKPLIPGVPLKHRSAALPSSLAAAASARIGASQSDFWPVRHGGALQSSGGGIGSTFTAVGARLRVPGGAVGLSLAAVGHGQQLEPVGAAVPIRARNRVLYRHGSLSEIYGNGPYGLEQSFTVARRPLGGAGPLVLAMRVDGSLVARQVGAQVVFRTHAGAVALRYGQLSAQDATGKRLPATMLLRSGVLELRVDDGGARYPLHIDPFVQQGSKLTGAEESVGDFGWSVALSASGSTALIGGPNDNSLTGAAWVFTRTGSTWTQQGPKLTGGGESGKGEFGFSVALSSDGNTALIGGMSDDGEVGAAWVFTRSGSTWTQQGSKLTGGGESGKGVFGYGVALSAEGNTAVIGGPRDNGSVGAAWVFTRSGSTWTQQGSKLTGGGESGKGELGYAVSLSSEGNTALLGGPEDVLGTGAAWVFTRSGSTWTQQGSKLTGAGASEFGLSVKLSAFGTTALIGGGGAAWVFTRSGSTWTQQGPDLTGSGESGKSYFGNSVALSGDGNTALIGGWFDNGGAGAAWVFTRSGSTWTQQGSKLTGSGASGKAYFGTGVALSVEGNTALIGGFYDNTGVGAAWVFVSHPGCTDSWTNTAGGSWFTDADWTNDAPPTSEGEACITEPGTYTVTMDQTSETGTVPLRLLTIGASEGTQTLAVASTCTQNATLAATEGIANGAHGAITMANADGCANNVTLKGMVTNGGSLSVENSNGGARTIEGNLTSTGTVSLGAGVALRIVGSYQQSSAATLKTFIAGASEYGSMSASGEASLAGMLLVHQTPPFEGSLGQTFLISASAGLAGSFATVSGDQINESGLYYKPAYFTNAVSVVPTLATLLASPTSGLPGSTVTISGTGYQPGDTITPAFTDHAGVKTALPSTTTNPGGNISTKITIPGSAAVGAGTITVTSGQTGVHVSQAFTVT
jgi:hypothetical protein